MTSKAQDLVGEAALRLVRSWVLTTWGWTFNMTWKQWNFNPGFSKNMNAFQEAAEAASTQLQDLCWHHDCHLNGPAESASKCSDCPSERSSWTQLEIKTALIRSWMPHAIAIQLSKRFRWWFHCLIGWHRLRIRSSLTQLPSVLSEGSFQNPQSFASWFIAETCSMKNRMLSPLPSLGYIPMGLCVYGIPFWLMCSYGCPSGKPVNLVSGNFSSEIETPKNRLHSHLFWKTVWFKQHPLCFKRPISFSRTGCLSHRASTTLFGCSNRLALEKVQRRSWSSWWAQRPTCCCLKHEISKKYMGQTEVMISNHQDLEVFRKSREPKMGQMQRSNTARLANEVKFSNMNDGLTPAAYRAACA